MKSIAILLCYCLTIPLLIADENKEGEKPVLVVSADGYPSGSSTPEGAASDLARAFMKRDSNLFRQICIKPFGGGENKKAYENFLANVSASIDAESKKGDPSPGGPKKITKVYAARHLSRNGPASAGYAMFNFHDIMFVDVQVKLVSGKSAQNRTMVIKKKDGTWYAHPAPHTASLLSVGLNDEPASTKDFKDAYTIKLPKSEQNAAEQPASRSAVTNK